MRCFRREPSIFVQDTPDVFPVTRAVESGRNSRAWMSWQGCLLVLLFVLFATAACISNGEGETATPVAAYTPVTLSSPGPENTPDLLRGRVTLSQTVISWNTYAYTLTPHHSIVEGSFDGESVQEHLFDAWIIENEYLKATLVPGFGGRIISLIYKPTGHEQLYRNPLGVPYLIGEGSFYYDWLMIYGGIFPTLPGPEHGKSWLLPWAFEIVEQTEREVVVAMSYVDDVDYPNTPGLYDPNATGLEATFTITLTAGRSALDTRIEIVNPGESSVAYEYWTNVGLAPGSDPADPRATAGAEIIAPMDYLEGWNNIVELEKATGAKHIYEFDTLRGYANWLDMGAVWAYPDLRETSFWGVINHDNEEGLIRIADNNITPGLKIWTFGYPDSSTLDPYATVDFLRPIIEMWAGVTRKFRTVTTLAPKERLIVEETYAPTVGLGAVSHANRDLIANLERISPQRLQVQLQSLWPRQHLRLLLSLSGKPQVDLAVRPEPRIGNQFLVELPIQGPTSDMELVIYNERGEQLFHTTVPAE